MPAKRDREQWQRAIVDSATLFSYWGLQLWPMRDKMCWSLWNLFERPVFLK
jgi:hypothetical protein